MKGIIKLLEIIVVVTVILFSFAACDTGGSGGGGDTYKYAGFMIDETDYKSAFEVDEVPNIAKILDGSKNSLEAKVFTAIAQTNGQYDANEGQTLNQVTAWLNRTVPPAYVSNIPLILNALKSRGYVVVVAPPENGDVGVLAISKE